MFKVRHEQRKVSGRITVEMALLLPVVFLWITWLVFFMVFLMDMSAVKSETMRLADETSMVGSKNRTKSKEAASRRLAKRIKSRLLITNCENSSVEIGVSRVISEGTVSFRWPFSGNKPAGVHGLRFSGRSKTPADDWEEYLRMRIFAMEAKKETGNKQNRRNPRRK